MSPSVDEQLLRGQSALLDLILGPVAEGEVSGRGHSAPSLGPLVCNGATKLPVAQPSK